MSALPGAPGRRPGVPCFLAYAASLTRNAIGVFAHGKLRSRIFWPRKNSSTASDSLRNASLPHTDLK
jgi:hypothetical protein